MSDVFDPESLQSFTLSHLTEVITALGPAIRHRLGSLALQTTLTGEENAWVGQVTSSAAALIDFGQSIISAGETSPTLDPTTGEPVISPTEDSIDQPSGSPEGNQELVTSDNGLPTTELLRDTVWLNPDIIPDEFRPVIIEADGLEVSGQNSDEPAAQATLYVRETATTEQASALSQEAATVIDDDRFTPTRPQPVATDSVETAQSSTTEGLELQIMAFALRGVFRMEELHRGIPELAAWDNKSPEWGRFKSVFPKLMESILARICAIPGGKAEWRSESRNRGQKYILEATIDGQQLTPSQAAELLGATTVEAKAPASQVDRPVVLDPAAQETAQAPASISPATDRLPTAVRRDHLAPFDRSAIRDARNEARRAGRTMDFAQQVLDYIRDLEAAAGGSGITINIIRDELGKALGQEITSKEVTNIVQSLRESGDLVKLGSASGYAVFTTHQDRAAQGSGERRSDSGSNRNSQEMRIEQLTEDFGDAIVVFLSTLGDKFRSEFRTEISAAIGGVVEVNDINAVCRRLQAQGLVEPVDQKGRGTGRTRKGITWRLTNRGRSRADKVLLQARGLSKTERKDAGAAFRY